MTIAQIQQNIQPSRTMTSLLCRFAGFYDGKLHKFILQDNDLRLVPAEPGFTPSLLIVSPTYYSEQQQFFPIDDKNELNKLLKLQFIKNEVSLLQTIKDGKSAVNVWRFHDGVPESLIRVPESFLLGSYCENGEILKAQDHQKQLSFITQFDGVLYSASQQGMINSTERFAISAGLSLEESQTLDFEDKARALANSFSFDLLKQLITFIKKPKQISAKSLLAQFAAPLLSATLIYLLITTVYILIKTSSVEKQLIQQQAEVSELLAVQSSLDNKVNTYEQLTNFWQTKTNSSGFWIVIAPLFDIAVIRNVNIENNVFFVRGTTDSASALLDVIAENPNVIGAKFETPVRNNRGMEQFNVSFKLKSKLILPMKEEAVANE